MQISSGMGPREAELPLGAGEGSQGSQHIGLESRSGARRLAAQPKHRCPWNAPGMGWGAGGQPPASAHGSKEPPGSSHVASGPRGELALSSTTLAGPLLHSVGAEVSGPDLHCEIGGRPLSHLNHVLSADPGVAGSAQAQSHAGLAGRASVGVL